MQLYLFMLLKKIVSYYFKNLIPSLYICSGNNKQKITKAYIFHKLFMSIKVAYATNNLKLYYFVFSTNYILWQPRRNALITRM